MRMTQQTKLSSTQNTRDRMARVLLILAALGAVFAFVSAIGSVQSATPATVTAEMWRMYGFVVFAGLFALLAARLRQMPGVWELVIFHKSATAITAALLIRSAVADASTVAIVDGVLAAITISAYVLARAFTGWAGVK
jgi:hypothetical protein